MPAQNLKEWTLLGEYCGVLDGEAVLSKAAEEEDNSALDDPLGLGPLLHDKVSGVGYTSKSAPAGAADGRHLTHVNERRLHAARVHVILKAPPLEH